MGPDLPKWVIVVNICSFFASVNSNSVEQKIYIKLNNTAPCVRLLNATHQIGCQSSQSGSTGVLHELETEADMEWILSKGPHPPYMVLMDIAYFTRSTMMRLKNSSRVAGAAVVIPSTSPAEGFSPHTTCPNENSGVYSKDYGASLANCNSTEWNPRGSGLSYEDFPFPIFSLDDDNETEVIRKCFLDHNVAVNGSVPQYPLCAMQLFSFMHAVTDTPTCMRRNRMDNSLNPMMFCDPLGDYNVLAFTRPINITAKGHKANESVVIAAARLDGRSFFWGITRAGESAVAGFVTLLAAAHALFPVTQQAPPSRNILFAFFQGEAFDYIGSSRLVYDMQKQKFVIDLDNVHSILEIGQVGLRSGQNLWMHTDPVSRANDNINEEVKALLNNLQSVASGLNLSLGEPAVSQALPPSSFQRFLRAKLFPGLVLTDHQSTFINRYYESVFDDAAYLNLTYPPHLSPEEKLEFVTDTARSLAEVATLVARTLYKQAGGGDAALSNISADPKIVTRMLYGFLIQGNNSWFKAVFNPDGSSKLTKTFQYYVGVNLHYGFIQYLLANLTGTATNLTQSQCQNPAELPNESKDLYQYLWVKGPVPANGTEAGPYCVRGTAYRSKATSPAFESGVEDFASTEYSTWTESRWKRIDARIFLVASQELEMLTLGVGIVVLVLSLLVTYFISSKAEILFSSTREPTTTTY